MPGSAHSLRVYLSHAWEDNAAALEVFQWLQKRGHQPWLAEASIPGGADWRLASKKALRESDVFIFCASRHTRERDGGFSRELDDALDLRKEAGEASLLIIPLCLDDGPIPPKLESFLAVRRGDPDYDQKLASALDSRAARTSAVVLSLHGIRTRGKWQKDVAPLLGQAGLVAVPLDFNWFHALQLLLPSSRQSKIEWFREEYFRQCARLRCKDPSILAHSFGSYLVAETMATYPQVRFDRIVLCGAIVRRDFPWKKVAANGQVRQVLNQYGGRDIWARVVEWAVKDAGQSGLKGFDPEPGRECLIQQKHPRFEHSDYFYDGNYADNWIPFLQGGDPGPEPISLAAPSNWRFRVTTAVVLLLAAVLAYVGYRQYQQRRGAGTAGPERPVCRLVDLGSGTGPSFLEPLNAVLEGREEPLGPVLQQEVDRLRSGRPGAPLPVKWLVAACSEFTARTLPRRVRLASAAGAVIAVYVIDEKEGRSRIAARPSRIGAAVALDPQPPDSGTLDAAVFIFPLDADAYYLVRRSDPATLLQFESDPETPQ